MSTADEQRAEMKAFFETKAPGSTIDIQPRSWHAGNNKTGIALAMPMLRLHCPNPSCAGEKNFQPEAEELETNSSHLPSTTVFSYVCKNCDDAVKIYSLYVKESDLGLLILKLSEHPSFGAPAPDKLLRLFGAEREYFLKGRQCENQGLGIGAFAYYRRVIEAKKNKIFDEVIKVARVLNAGDELIAELEAAKDEKQFTNAVKAIKHAIPQVLLINGENPLTLLHDVLSDGIHGLTDEECLDVATSIRSVLMEFSRRLTEALETNNEARDAVANLLRRKQAKTSALPPPQ